VPYDQNSLASVLILGIGALKIMAVVDESKKQTTKRYLYEILIVTLITIGASFVSPVLKYFAYCVPITYLIIDRKQRSRSWGELGIKFKHLGNDLIANWYLFVIVGVAIQFAVPFLSKWYWPELIDHILNRLPSLNAGSLYPLAASIIFVALIEEIIFRGLLQERLSWYFGKTPAIMVASVAFGLMHYSRGAFPTVTVDMALVALDGVFYGLIYARCRSIFVAWAAHVTADLVGLAILVLLF
jgi:uncharacterized protein